MVKLLIFIEFSSVLNTRFMGLFNVTLAVSLVASTVLYVSYIAFRTLCSTILSEMKG